MILIMFITISLASFFFAQVGAYLSAKSKSAVMPFILTAVIIELPIVINILFGFGSSRIQGFLPLNGMISTNLVRANALTIEPIFQIIVLVAAIIILPKLTLKEFAKSDGK